MRSLLTRSLNPSPTWRVGTLPFSRHDILQIIAALIANATPVSGASTRRKRYVRGLHLWATLLSVIAEHEGRTIEQASILSAIAAPPAFSSAN